MSAVLSFLLFSAAAEDSANIVNYSGDRIIFKVDSSLVHISGNAEADYGNLSVNSDTIIYDLREKYLEARGNVVFNDGENDIDAEKMTYYVEKKMGTALEARTEVEKGYLYGKRVRYYEGNILKIADGYFTTCDKEDPHYWFYSPKMRVDLDDNFVAEPLILLVRDIPVLAVPFWFQSIKKERSSGITVFSFGSSSYGGKYIKNIGWYQTLGPHADATVAFDYYTEMGVKGHLDSRWRFNPYASGEMSGSYIRERESGNERWSLKFNNNSRLPGGLGLNIYSDVASDNEYRTDYQPGEVENLIKDISYGGNISGNFFGTSFYGVMEYRENPRDSIIDKKWPKVNLNFPRFNFGPFNLKSSSKFIRDETEHWATGVSGGLGLNFRLSILNLNLNLSGSSDYYEREDVNVNHWSSDLSAGTRLYGLSLFGIPPVSKFRHVMTPSVSFGYAPDRDSVEVQTLPGFGIPGGKKYFRISLSNLFQCKINERKYDFARLSLSSRYKPEEDKFSDINIGGDFWIQDYLKQHYSTTYDPYDREFGDRNINTTFRYKTEFGGKPLTLQIKHNINFREEQNIQQADLQVGVFPTPGWKLNLNSHYDFEENKITSNSINLTRDLHCWELSMSVNTFGESWNYDVRLHLKDIPELEVDRGTFQDLLP